ncbi:PTS sugar transporter subunit IIA [Thermosediminibacter litoriperuensis]|uniref:PTS system D-fructose-specific IIA component (F1P-forming), Frc family (TC 4.A.2.1.4) n=1 Tax=Thermosediminibacter litoriperuensis TaxID=291989 RepID=A0A5S5AJ35_9FIRM|nr:fructose PTS transporter subunit IIA [Thermosediminibacter litoriperuensis]TYP50902.1 PTS system D-fructose-specific IIA component (F1P-forming), Frc family (TC 4.A.2.1.4) [Thermosediminibacter litoriperuensis]
MRIRDILNKDCIDLNLKSTDKESVIKELISLLVNRGLIADKEEFFHAVWEREKTYTTGIGMGIAIPHGKSKSVKRAAVAFGKSERGIDFDSLDGKPAHLFFLIAVPEESHDLHLELISTLSRKLMHEEVRRALNEADTQEKVLEALSVDVRVN